MTLAVLLLIVSLALILLAAELFTNAVEWLGQHLGLNQGTVGSVLAAVGTALPETLIPLVAIVFTGGAGHDIGVGAILGAPFMLSTAAFAITGLGVLYFSASGRRTREMKLNALVVRRDMRFFLAVYAVAIASTALPFHGLKVATAVLLLTAYGYYVWRTVAAEGAVGNVFEPLYLARAVRVRANRPPPVLTWLQFAAALALIVAGARVFVTNMETVADGVGLPPLILSLILAPLATELPEKFNSVIWVREDKDTLAMGNITGAMVFQSAIPVSIGLVFTSWELTEPALIAAGIAMLSTALVALSIGRRGELNASVLARAGLLYVAFVTYVVLREAL